MDRVAHPIAHRLPAVVVRAVIALRAVVVRAVIFLRAILVRAVIVRTVVTLRAVTALRAVAALPTLAGLTVMAVRAALAALAAPRFRRRPGRPRWAGRSRWLGRPPLVGRSRWAGLASLGWPGVARYQPATLDGLVSIQNPISPLCLLPGQSLPGPPPSALADPAAVSRARCRARRSAFRLRPFCRLLVC
jgi:hypothetical protein